MKIRKKIISTFFCMLLIATISPITGNVLAGDEENPEIEDQSDANHFIDIQSAWFNENSGEPDYLYVSLKLLDIRTSIFGGEYQVLWTYNGVKYAVHGGLDHAFVPYELGWKCGEHQRGSTNDIANMADCEAIVDRESGIITWKVPKNEIGNPQIGDALSKTYAKSCLEFIPYFKILMMIPGLHDCAGDLEGHNYGKDYTIQY